MPLSVLFTRPVKLGLGCGNPRVVDCFGKYCVVQCDGRRLLRIVVVYLSSLLCTSLLVVFCSLDPVYLHQPAFTSLRALSLVDLPACSKVTKYHRSGGELLLNLDSRVNCA